MTQPNHRLAQVLREADMPKKALARAVNARGAANDEDLNTDHSLVTKWLAGVQPRGSKPRYVAEVLSAQVGRTLTPEDLGFTCDVPAIDRAIRYDPGDDDIAGLLAGVWSADLEGRPEALDAEIQPAAWRESARYLLIGQRRTMTAIPTGSLRVGLSDVAAIRATHDHFAGLDDRYGGGLGRQSLIAFLARDVVPLLSGTCADRTRSILLSTVAESTLLAAWMSYDAGLHGLAQRYFVQALRLAEEAGDRRLAGSVLSAMSHQATFLGYYKDAAELARAAVAAIATDGTATLRAQFHAMEARALARTGDPAACDQAIGDALRHFEQRRPDDDPLWISYFDDIELAAELGHCYRDLTAPLPPSSSSPPNPSTRTSQCAATSS